MKFGYQFETDDPEFSEGFQYLLKTQIRAPMGSFS
jgi:hypothetical protein